VDVHAELDEMGDHLLDLLVARPLFHYDNHLIAPSLPITLNPLGITRNEYPQITRNRYPQITRITQISLDRILAFGAPGL
jgi:hypothetical protein